MIFFSSESVVGLASLKTILAGNLNFWRQIQNVTNPRLEFVRFNCHFTQLGANAINKFLRNNSMLGLLSLISALRSYIMLKFVYDIGSCLARRFCKGDWVKIKQLIC